MRRIMQRDLHFQFRKIVTVWYEPAGNDDCPVHPVIVTIGILTMGMVATDHGNRGHLRPGPLNTRRTKWSS